MGGWSEVVRYPLGLAGFALYIVFKVYLHRSRSQGRAASAFFLQFLATVAMFGGLTVSLLQATVPAFADIVRSILGVPQAVPVSYVNPQNPQNPQHLTPPSSLDGIWYLRMKTSEGFGTLVQKGYLVIRGANAEIREEGASMPATWNLTGDVLTVRMANTGDPQMDTMLNTPFAAMISPLMGMPLTRRSNDLFESGPLPGDSTTFTWELFRTRR